LDARLNHDHAQLSAGRTSVGDGATAEATAAVTAAEAAADAAGEANAGKQEQLLRGWSLNSPRAVDMTRCNIPGTIPSTSATNSGFPSPRNARRDDTTNSVFSFPDISFECTCSARATDAFRTEFIPSGFALKNSSRNTFILI
jgi:hypothetical protein